MTSIETACRIFLRELGKDATNEEVFPTLARVAEWEGLNIQARQLGINGTFICFVKDENNAPL